MGRFYIMANPLKLHLADSLYMFREYQKKNTGIENLFYSLALSFIDNDKRDRKKDKGRYYN